MKNLSPALKLQDISVDDVVNIRYREGIPLSYRFDASRGIVNFDGKDTVSGKNGVFSVVPVAMRIFEGVLFDYSHRLWAELFFINSDGNMCCIMFHGYSVEELKSLESDLYYSDLKINEVILTMTPKKTESKETGNTFYIATFDFEKADADYLDVVGTVCKDFRIFRQDTRREMQVNHLTLNYTILPEVHQISEPNVSDPVVSEAPVKVEVTESINPVDALAKLKDTNQVSS